MPEELILSNIMEEDFLRLMNCFTQPFYPLRVLFKKDHHYFPYQFNNFSILTKLQEHHLQLNTNISIEKV